MSQPGPAGWIAALAERNLAPQPTDHPARQFELMFRLYAPKKELFDKAWKLPDVGTIAAQ
jgi:hypothetical protein